MNTKSNIYISNYWWTENYGATLTAYALQLLVPQSVLCNNKDKILLLKQEKFDKNFSQNFAKRCLNYTSLLLSYKDYYSLLKNSRIFITGSDQVFRASSLSSKLYSQNFLDFVEPYQKKIAFSASFAVNKEDFLKETSSNLIEKMKKSLQSFDFISVREKSGVEICKEVLGVDAEWIIDPVFILEKAKYDKLINNATKDYSNKIVSYVLDNNKSYDKAYRHFEKQYGSKVVKLADSNESVENWLSAIKNCKLFVTDSFHGLCFALIFNKPFICISNKSRGAARFDSILEMLNIENQCINSIDETYTKDCIFKVDYEKVNQRIEEERQKGLAFLQKALESPIGKFEEKQAVRTQYLEETVCKLEQQANLKYQIKKELWNLWLIIFHKYLPEPVKNIIRKIRGSK